LIQKRERN